MGKAIFLIDKIDETKFSKPKGTIQEQYDTAQANLNILLDTKQRKKDKDILVRALETGRSDTLLDAADFAWTSEVADKFNKYNSATIEQIQKLGGMEFLKWEMGLPITKEEL